MIDPLDEKLHEAGADADADADWQESFYFNWSDPRHDVFGLARIGFRFADRKIDGLVLTIRDGKPEYCYPAVGLSQHGPWSEQTVEGGLRAKNLVVKMEEPLSRWRLTLDGPNSMDLVFTATTPPFDYQDGGEIAPTMTGEHFEQSGTVTGWTQFRGTRLDIDATGQRDKSWGVRAWRRVEGWNWISAQFGPDLTFNALQTMASGDRFDNGFVHRDGANHAIEKLGVDFEWGAREHVPARAHLEILDAGGGHYDVTARARGHFPLFKSGAWVQETQADFVLRDANGTSHDGAGVIEHVWRPSVLEGVRRLPDALRAVRVAQWRP